MEETSRRTIIRMRGIYKRFYIGAPNELEILHGIDLDVQEGEFLSIVGPSGSGKSTLMNVIGVLDRPTEGTYDLDGTVVSQARDDELSSIRNRKIGFVFQNFNLISRTNAQKNVELPMMDAGIPARRRRAPARAAVGVEDFFFWGGSGLYLFSRVSQENEGALRGYFLLGAAAGMAAWHWSLSEYSVKYLSKLLGIPVGKLLILLKRLKFWTMRCKIFLCGRFRQAEHRWKKKVLWHRGDRYGRKKEIRKEKAPGKSGKKGIGKQGRYDRHQRRGDHAGGGADGTGTVPSAEDQGE